jgi:signal transduction histidine kinase
MSSGEIPASFCLVLILFLSLSLPAGAAGPVVLSDGDSYWDINGHVSILEDRAAKWTIDDMNAPDVARQFRETMREDAGAGMTNNVYWLRIPVENKGTDSRHLLLEIDFPHMDFVELYVPRGGGGYDVQQAGDRRPMNVRRFPHRNPVFPVDVPAGESSVYLRLDPHGFAVFPMTLSAPEHFFAVDRGRQMWFGLYFGAMLVMAVYNLFLFFSLRDRNYLNYIFYVFAFVLGQLSFEGFAIEYCPAGTFLPANYLVSAGALMILSANVFTRRFLQTALNAPRTDTLLLFTLLIASIGIPAFLVMPQLAAKQVMAALCFMSAAGALSAGGIVYLKGFRPARYFLLARIVLHLSSLSMAFTGFGIGPGVVWSYRIIMAGSVIDVLFISFALADRINTLRQEKEKAEAESMRASHLATLGELAAGVAHEINTPLNTIINSADLLQDARDQKELQHDASVIKKEGKRIAKIVSSLLFFARRPESEAMPHSVAELSTGALDLIGAKLRKEGIILNMNIAPSLPAVVVHPQQIEQVFLNIISNAEHSLNERYPGSDPDKRIDIEAVEMTRNNAPFVRVTIRDNGAGIPAALAGKVTEPFFTTKKAGVGTGLGLSISSDIIKSHKGTLTIESQEGEFTKVIIDLPAFEKRRADTAPGGTGAVSAA